MNQIFKMFQDTMEGCANLLCKQLRQHATYECPDPFAHTTRPCKQNCQEDYSESKHTITYSIQPKCVDLTCERCHKAFTFATTERFCEICCSPETFTIEKDRHLTVARCLQCTTLMVIDNPLNSPLSHNIKR